MPADSLVILLHGVGAMGADLAPLGRLWGDQLPDTAFAWPDAPYPSDFSGGRQWFSVANVTPDNRPGRILAARPAFDAVLSGIIALNGLSGRPERVVLAGFSQGTIMALDAVASGRWPVAAVLGFSGRLATPEPLAPAADTRLFLAHGLADPVIPAAETEQAAARLSGMGLDVETSFEDGLGHGISPGSAARAGAILRDLFGK